MRTPTPLEPLWQYWRDALEDSSAVPPARPQCGFYRVTGLAAEKGKRQSYLDNFIRQRGWTPAAFWVDQIVDQETGELADDERFLVCVRGKIVSGKYVQELWDRCKFFPVTYEAYEHALIYGQWADDAPKTKEPKPEIVKAADIRRWF